MFKTKSEGLCCCFCVLETRSESLVELKSWKIGRISCLKSLIAKFVKLKLEFYVSCWLCNAVLHNQCM